MRRNARSHRITDFFPANSSSQHSTMSSGTDLSQPSSMSQSTVDSMDLKNSKGLTEAFNKGKNGKELHSFFTKKRTNSYTISNSNLFVSEAPTFPVLHAVPVNFDMLPCNMSSQINPRDNTYQQHSAAVPYARFSLQVSSGVCDQLQCPKRLVSYSTDNCTSEEDILARTMHWIQSLEEQTDHWDFDSSQQSHPIIVHLHGSDDQLQISLARKLAGQLQLDHVVFDACDTSPTTGIRDGKPFEDYLCRRRHFSSNSQSSSLTGKRQFKSESLVTQMVVVADLDLVYSQDRFYSALNAFVRQLSTDTIHKTLILLLSQSCTGLLARHVSFIPDFRSTNSSASLLSMAIPTVSVKRSFTDCTCTNVRDNLKEAMNLSDLCWLEDYSLFGNHLQFVEDDIPVSCIPHDHNQSSDNILIEKIERSRRQQRIVSVMPSSSQWTGDLLPYWMELERAFVADPFCRFRMSSSSGSRSTRLRPLARHQRHYLSQPHPFL